MILAAGASVQSQGYNLIGFGNATGPFTAAGDQRFVSDPMLDSLADNGGPTPTHALLTLSPAIDAGDPDAEAGVDDVPLYDQRGLPFGRVADGDTDGTPRIDIGAYEVPLSFVVDTLADEDDSIGVGSGTSLRDAINAANAVAGGVPLILFDDALTAGGPAVIELTLGQLEITGSMAIFGPGADLLTVDAQHNSRVLMVEDSDNFNQLEVSVSGVTLQGGNDLDAGGGIFSQELLTVSDSVITGNTAPLGGGIYNAPYGELTVVRCEISGNSGTTAGGGIYNWGGFAEIRDTTVDGNDSPDGAGLYNNYAGNLLLARSTVSGNIALNTGGGIHNDSGYVLIEDSTVSLK